MLSTLFVIAFMSSALGHSWIEEISLLAADGSILSPPGYPRGNGLSSLIVLHILDIDQCLVPQTSNTFLQLSDKVMTHLLPPSGRPDNVISPTDPICMPTQQLPETTAGNHILKAPPGSQILLHYQENGHVTLLSNTLGKATSGTVSIYGTNQSLSSDTLHSIHNVWNALGTRGDCRGRLLA